MSLEAYGDFALVYDEALGQPFARAARPILERVIRNHLGDWRGDALDLACGTGLSSETLQALGFRPVGLDASIPMLVRARPRNERRVAADLRRLPLKRTFRLVSCLYDSLNHMLETADLQAAFSEAARLLEPDGLFLFDVNQPEAYEALWDSDEPFRHDDRSVSLVMHTFYDAATEVATAVIEGTILGGSGRIEFEEIRQQRAWSFDAIEQALTRAGLRIEDTIDFDPFDQSRDSGVGIKWLIAARS